MKTEVKVSSDLHPGDEQSGSGAAVCREESQYVDHSSKQDSRRNHWPSEGETAEII